MFEIKYGNLEGGTHKNALTAVQCNYEFSDSGGPGALDEHEILGPGDETPAQGGEQKMCNEIQ